MISIDIRTNGKSKDVLIELLNSIPELEGEVHIYKYLTFVTIKNADGWYGMWNNQLHISNSNFIESHSVEIPIDEIYSITSL